MNVRGHDSNVQDQLYFQMFQVSSHACGMIDKQGRWIDVNPALCRLIGYEKQDVLGRRCDELPKRIGPEQDSFQFEQALRGKLPIHRSERLCYHKDGVPLLLAFTMTPIMNACRNTQDFFIQFDPHEPAVKLQQSASKCGDYYRAISRITSDALVLFDLTGIVLEINEAYTRVFGWRADELIGKKLPATPSEYQQHTRYLIDTASTGKPVTSFETVKYRKDGSLIDVSISIMPLFDDSGEIVALASMSKDLTLQNKLWQVVRESEEMFSTLMEHTPESFLVAQDDRCVYANTASAQLLGTSRKEELIGRHMMDFVDEDSAAVLEERIEWAKQGLINGPAQLRMRRLDGQTVHAEMVAIPAMFAGEPSIHMLIRDITERKRAEELFRMSDKMKAVGQLAAGLAHEIRNPLTAIKGFVQLAEWQSSSKSEYFSIIKSEIERIDSITSEMLMLAKPNLCKMHVTDLRTILKSVSALLETQAIMSNIEIVCNFSELPGWVECDENQIKQVFVNLIKNAIEAMRAGGRITVSASRQDGSVYAAVTDEGCGIPDELLAKIGQPFYTTKEKGTGLGLMVSYKIIENHRGSISVHSVNNFGTTFNVRLPYASPAEPYM